MNKVEIPMVCKIKILKSTIIIAMALFTGIQSHSQSEFKVSLGPQVHFAEIELESSIVKSSFEPGAGIAGGISMGLTDRWSLHSGLAVNYFQSRNAIKNYSGLQNAFDTEGEAFEFRYSAANYSEVQKLTAVSIPLAIQFETSGATRFYTKLGVEASFFINEKSDSRATTLTTSGFFPRFNAVLEGPSFAGFGTYSDQQFNEADLDLKNSYNATIEFGLKQIYSSGSALYIGGFFKYGMNDISNSKSTDGLISFDSQNPTIFRSTSVINALENPGGSSGAISSKANLHIMGVTFRYEFDL